MFGGVAKKKILKKMFSTLLSDCDGPYFLTEEFKHKVAYEHSGFYKMLTDILTPKQQRYKMWRQDGEFPKTEKDLE